VTERKVEYSASDDDKGAAVKKNDSVQEAGNVAPDDDPVLEPVDSAPEMEDSGPKKNDDSAREFEIDAGLLYRFLNDIESEGDAILEGIPSEPAVAPKELEAEPELHPEGSESEPELAPKELEAEPEQELPAMEQGSVMSETGSVAHVDLDALLEELDSIQPRSDLVMEEFRHPERQDDLAESVSEREGVSVDVMGGEAAPDFPVINDDADERTYADPRRVLAKVRPCYSVLLQGTAVCLHISPAAAPGFLAMHPFYSRFRTELLAGPHDADTVLFRYGLAIEVASELRDEWMRFGDRRTVSDLLDAKANEYATNRLSLQLRVKDDGADPVAETALLVDLGGGPYVLDGVVFKYYQFLVGDEVRRIHCSSHWSLLTAARSLQLVDISEPLAFWTYGGAFLPPDDILFGHEYDILSFSPLKTHPIEFRGVADSVTVNLKSNASVISASRELLATVPSAHRFVIARDDEELLNEDLLFRGVDRATATFQFIAVKLYLVSDGRRTLRVKFREDDPMVVVKGTMERILRREIEFCEAVSGTDLLWQVCESEAIRITVVDPSFTILMPDGRKVEKRIDPGQTLSEFASALDLVDPGFFVGDRTVSGAAAFGKFEGETIEIHQRIAICESLRAMPSTMYCRPGTTVQDLLDKDDKVLLYGGEILPLSMPIARVQLVPGELFVVARHWPLRYCFKSSGFLSVPVQATIGDVKRVVHERSPGILGDITVSVKGKVYDDHVSVFETFQPSTEFVFTDCPRKYCFAAQGTDDMEEMEVDYDLTVRQVIEALWVDAPGKVVMRLQGSDRPLPMDVRLLECVPRDEICLLERN
jgi:hypothetical protein